MHLRRALLLFAIVLMVAALAATLAPSDGSNTKPSPPPAAARDRNSSATQRVIVDGRSGRRASERVGQGTHVVLTVPVGKAGDVLVPRLNLITAAEPGTPAVFDFIADRPGPYPVALDPTRGNTAHLGRLDVVKR